MNRRGRFELPGAASARRLPFMPAVAEVECGWHGARDILRRRAIPPALLLLALLAVACTPPRERVFMPQAWATGPSESVASTEAPREQTPCFTRKDNTIRVSGAVKETVAFEYVLSATTGPVAGLEISAADLSGPGGTIDKSTVHIYRHWPVVVEQYPNWYLRSVGLRERREIPDALVPIESRNFGQPFNLAAGANLPLWVEIRIPGSAQPGVYHTTLTARDAAGNQTKTAVELTIRDIFLAPEDAIPILACVQLGPIIASHTQADPLNIKLAIAQPDAERVIRRTFAILHDHGLSPYTDEVKPWFRQDASGTVDIDWSQYDAFCEPLIDGSAYNDKRPAASWPIPADLRQPDPIQYNGIGSAVYAAVLKDYLKKAAAHAEQEGWLQRSFVYFHLADRPDPTAADYALVRQLATVTHLADPRLAFVSTFIPQPMAPFGWFGHHYEDLTAEVNIWATPARYQHQPTLEQQRTLGKQTWLPPDSPPFSGSLAVEAPLIQARSLPWQAFLQGHDAVILPQVTEWPSDPFKEPVGKTGLRSDTWLLYPGRSFNVDEPLPSARLKQLQLGLQDYQYLRLLEKHGRGETARLLAGSLIKAAGTDAYGDNYEDGVFGRRIDDPEVWALARSILEEEVADTVSEEPGKVVDVARNQAAWAKFLGATRAIEIWPESARMTIDERGEQGGYLIAYDVAVRSEMRTPVEGKLSFGFLANGVKSVSDIVRVGPLGEMAMARKQVIAETVQPPPCDLDGHYAQEIVFDAGLAGRTTANATVSLVNVPSVATAPTVDGDLSDWPPNELNACGDFRLLNGRRGGIAAGEAAQSQTVVFLCQAEGKLFIGIRAAVPDVQIGPEEPARFSNVVHYDNLMPLGSDLVEFMFDPTNAGTQSGDLFHIVLKSNGGSVFERGVGASPPIGKCGAWPDKLPDYCVTATSEGWSAEIAIPIATFGPEAGKTPIWGFNVARLEPKRGEYSDWARAPRYCYDPRTLGNMLWPR